MKDMLKHLLSTIKTIEFPILLTVLMGGYLIFYVNEILGVTYTIIQLICFILVVKSISKKE